MSMEHLLAWELARKTEALGGNLPQCHFVYHKSHMTWPEIELGPSRRLTAWAKARPYPELYKYRSIPSRPVSLRTLSILSSDQWLGFPSCLCLTGFHTKTFYALFFSPMRVTYLSHSILLDLGSGTNDEAPHYEVCSRLLPFPFSLRGKNCPQCFLLTFPGSNFCPQVSGAGSIHDFLFRECTKQNIEGFPAFRQIFQLISSGINPEDVRRNVGNYFKIRSRLLSKA
jgi:hypothetical protein